MTDEPLEESSPLTPGRLRKLADGAEEGFLLVLTGPDAAEEEELRTVLSGVRRGESLRAFGLSQSPEPFPRTVAARRHAGFLRQCEAWLRAVPEEKRESALFIDISVGAAPESAANRLGAMSRLFRSARTLSFPDAVKAAGEKALTPDFRYWKELERSSEAAADGFYFERAPGSFKLGIASGKLSPDLFWIKRIEAAEILASLSGLPWSAARGAETAVRYFTREAVRFGLKGDARALSRLELGMLFHRLVSQEIRNRYPAYSRALGFWLLALAGKELQNGNLEETAAEYAAAAPRLLSLVREKTGAKGLTCGFSSPLCWEAAKGAFAPGSTRSGSMIG